MSENLGLAGAKGVTCSMNHLFLQNLLSRGQAHVGEIKCTCQKDTLITTGNTPLLLIAMQILHANTAFNTLTYALMNGKIYNGICLKIC